MKQGIANAYDRNSQNGNQQGTGITWLWFGREWHPKQEFSHKKAVTRNNTAKVSAQGEPEEFAIENKDRGGDNPRGHICEPGISEFSHPPAVAGELHQGNDSKR